MKLRGIIGADVNFSAYHFDGQMSEGWHPHDWTVTCWAKFPPWRDLRTLRAAMQQVVDAVAPEGPPGERRIARSRWTNEAIGEAFLTLANVKWVWIDREGFHARLWR